MKVVAFTGLALLALSACGQAATPPDGKTGHTTVAAVTNKPGAAPGAAAVGTTSVDLTPYVGKYPFDVVRGHRFLDHPAVKKAIAAAVPDAKMRALVQYKDGELGVPIIRVEGDRILIWGGRNHTEDRYNWSVVIAPDGSKPEVCIYDGLGYDDDFQSSQWFEPGRPSIMKQGKCPSDGEEYPAAPIAVG